MYYVKLSLDNTSYNSKPNEREIISIQSRISNKECVIDVETAARLIGEQEYSFCPGIFKGKRCKADFKEMQLFALDFDNGISYKEIKKRAEELKIQICFAYHTLSSTEEKEKYRVVFLHDCIVDNIQIAELILEMLIYLFPECDRCCSDASRLFLGGKKLIDYAESSFSIVDLKNICQMQIKQQDTSNHYARTIERLGKRHGVFVDAKMGLMIFENNSGVEIVRPGSDILTGVSKNSPILENVIYLGENKKYIIF